MDKDVARQPPAATPAPATLPDDPAALKALLLAHQQRIAKLERGGALSFRLNCIYSHPYSCLQVT